MGTWMKAKILLIEGKRSEHPSFTPGLEKKDFQVASVPSGKAALGELAQFKPHIILVDAASLHSNGRRICQSLRETAPSVPLILIVAEAIPPSQKINADSALVRPFTLQKLLNRIRPYLPVDQKMILRVGPLQLDTDQHLVRCGERQAPLTPRLVVLLKFFMEHPGEVIERNELFRKVWDTNYTADTRTLDVHISWLRIALEDDPRHPRYLKTIRGLGYRLDIEGI